MELRAVEIWDSLLVAIPQKGLGLANPCFSERWPELERDKIMVQAPGCPERSLLRAFTVENVSDLPDVATNIVTELRNQYVLGNRPSHKVHDARWRKIKVKLRTPKGFPPLTAYAKTGYYAPSR